MKEIVVSLNEFIKQIEPLKEIYSCLKEAYRKNK